MWRIELTGPSGPSHVEAEVVLLAVGRRPNTDLLDPAAGGLALHDDDRLVVDAEQRTTADGVWALGDICSEHQLKHVANHEARVVAHNLAVDLGRSPGTRGATTTVPCRTPSSATRRSRRSGRPRPSSRRPAPPT